MSPGVAARDTSYCACETSFSAMIDVIQIWTSTRIGSAMGDALKYALTYVCANKLSRRAGAKSSRARSETCPRENAKHARGENIALAL